MNKDNEAEACLSPTLKPNNTKYERITDGKMNTTIIEILIIVLMLFSINCFIF